NEGREHVVREVYKKRRGKEITLSLPHALALVHRLVVESLGSTKPVAKLHRLLLVSLPHGLALLHRLVLPLVLPVHPRLVNPWIGFACVPFFWLLPHDKENQRKHLDFFFFFFLQTLNTLTIHRGLSWVIPPKFVGLQLGNSLDLHTQHNSEFTNPFTGFQLAVLQGKGAFIGGAFIGRKVCCIGFDN
ncbi:GPI-anchored surface protein, putative, partial [Bodo saltans]